MRLSVLRPKSLRKWKGNMFPGQMLLTRKDSIKNKYQNVSLTSSTSDLFWLKFSIFFDLLFFHFSYNFEWKFSKMKKNEIENFRNLFDLKNRNFSFKIVWKWKFLRSKKIENFRLNFFVRSKCCNFTPHKSILDFLDLKLCRFFTRRRWNGPEYTALHAEIIKRVL